MTRNGTKVSRCSSSVPHGWACRAFRVFSGSVLAFGLVLGAGVAAVAKTLAGVVAASTDPAQVPANGRSEDRHLHIEFRNGRVTMEVWNTPLTQAVTGLAEEAGLQVTFKDDFSYPVTLSFSAATLDQALHRLLGPLSFVTLYNESGRRERLILLPQNSGPDGTEALEKEPKVPLLVELSAAEKKTWILACLNRGDRNARIVAIRRALTLEPALASEIAAKVLQEDPDPVVRGQAARTIGKIGGDRAAALLDPALSDEDASVHRQAVRALADLEEDLAVLMLGQVLQDDLDPKLRDAAFQARALAEARRSETSLKH